MSTSEATRPKEVETAKKFLSEYETLCLKYGLIITAGVSWQGDSDEEVTQEIVPASPGDIATAVANIKIEV